MTNQELLEAIAGYLPYDVKAIARYEQKTVKHKVGLRDLAYVLDRLDIIEFKLILYPLPDLIKPCLEGGKVPIVEIAKRLLGESDGAEYRYYIQGNTAECYVYYHNIGKPDSMQGFYINIKHPDMNSHRVVKELHRFHIDVEGLIEKGYAIDINTLNDDSKAI